MGWDGAGGYTRQHNFSADASAGIKILAARMDAEIDDMASAITIAWARNGQNVPTQAVPMGGQRFINVGAAASVGDYMRVREFVENVPIFMQDAETSADRISVSAQYFTSVSANQAPGDGTRILVRAGSNKSSAALYLNGHSANVEYQDGNRIGPALVSGGVYEFIFSSVDAAWKMPKPDDGRTTAETSAGVTPTNYQFRPSPIIELERYLTPHATNDNTAGLQAALDHANALGGAIIQAPAGTIRYDGTITMPRYVTLRGLGWSTIFKPLSSSGVINLVDGNNVFQDIFFEGSVTTPGSYVGTCFVIGPTDFTGHHTFRRVYVRRFQIGVRSRAALWTRFEQCRIEFNRAGIDFDSLSVIHQNNAIAIIDCLIGFNERQGIATTSSPISNRGLIIQGGSIEGNGDADYTTYAQCELNRFSEAKITTYFESLSVNAPDALTIDNCGSMEIVSCSFIGARNAIRDRTGSTTGRIYIARNTGSGIVTRGVDLAGGTDNEVERSNSWSGAGSANIVTGTRCHDYTNRKAEFLNQQTGFTPTLVGASTAGTPTYTVQTGYYSRIDNLIFVQGRVSVTDLGGMSGLVSVRGLPATSVNNTHGHGNITVVIDGCTVSGGNTQFTGQIAPNTAQIDLIQQGSTANLQITAAGLAAATTVIFSGWYVAA